MQGCREAKGEVFLFFWEQQHPDLSINPGNWERHYNRLLVKTVIGCAEKTSPGKKVKLIPGREAEFNGVWAGFLGRDLELSLKGGPGKTG